MSGNENKPQKGLKLTYGEAQDVIREELEKRRLKSTQGVRGKVRNRKERKRPEKPASNPVTDQGQQDKNKTIDQ